MIEQWGICRRTKILRVIETAPHACLTDANFGVAPNLGRLRLKNLSVPSVVKKTTFVENREKTLPFKAKIKLSNGHKQFAFRKSSRLETSFQISKMKFLLVDLIFL